MLLASIAAVALPLAAACGEETLESGDLEAELGSDLGQDAGVEPRAVECPDDIAAEAGEEFECTLIAPNGDEVRVVGTVTNDEGGFEARVPAKQFE